MGLLNKLNVDGLLGKLQKATADLLTNDDAYADRSCNNSSGEKVFFCSRCGAKLNAAVKFCHDCGSAVGDTSQDTAQPAPIQENRTIRQQEYAGVMIKCPNCGTTITQTTAICPDCGYHITGQEAVRSVQAFNEQLMNIETTRKKPGLGSVFGVAVDPADQKKLTLIRNFPIPNSIDDVFEFIVLAATNIDVGLSKNTMMNRYQSSAKYGESSLTISKTISDAWISKMQQAYQKAQFSFASDPAFEKIRQIYLDKMRELKIKVN